MTNIAFQPATTTEKNESGKLPRLLVVLPAYNEGAALCGLSALFAQAIQRYPFQIIVVDDGSTDDSMRLLEEAQIPHLDIVRHTYNKGLGKAIKTGFSIALARAEANDMIVVMDSDGTHSPYLIERMAGLIQCGGGLPISLRLSSGWIGLVPYFTQSWLQLDFSNHRPHFQHQGLYLRLQTVPHQHSPKSV
ncbi:glycosyltransferase family 2 protein [Vampirovibrio sp.]|uniref:glycosyltransferase family 2 protein n=1 Tax=Vampirovibrio sp. TaxID=2717857 RepID=UPI00359433E7